MHNVRHPSNLKKIWKKFAPFQKEKTRVDLEIACQHKSRELQHKEPRISHIVSVLLLILDLYTDDPNGIGETLNIFLLPDLPLSESSEDTLVARMWDTDFILSTLKTFSDTVALLNRQKVPPTIGWE